MKRIIVGMKKQFVEEFVRWLDENNIIHYKPFEIDGVWKIPCLPLGKEQKRIFEEYMEFRCYNDLV